LEASAGIDATAQEAGVRWVAAGMVPTESICLAIHGSPGTPRARERCNEAMNGKRT